MKISKRSLFICCTLVISSCSEPFEESKPEIRYKIGDNTHWSEIEYDDSDWSLHKGNTGNNIFWARMNLELDENPRTFQKLGIYLDAFGAYDAYWDGVLLGINGMPGEEHDSIKTGQYQRYFMVPDSLSEKGKHVLALRVSQKYLNNHDTVRQIILFDYFDLVRGPLKQSIYISIVAGAFLITSIYFFLLYMTEKKSFPILLFSLTSLLFFLLLSTEYIRYLIPIHYSYYYVRLEIINILTLLLSFLVPYYFSIQFSVFNKKALLPIYLLILISIYLYYDYDRMVANIILTMWISCVLIVGYAVLKKGKGSQIVFLGLLINAFIHYDIDNYDNNIVYSFIIFLLCMLYILALRLKERRKAYENSLLQATRLKYELLKKKIQPHFLMNTLTSLIDWVEESPQKGIQFIEELAEEFNLLNQIEDKQLIPIEQEIQLCKSHLKIMEYRKEIKYIWEDRSIDVTEEIPPALIHTLLENGITHCFPPDDRTIRFQLSYKKGLTYKTYEFFTYAKVRNAVEKISEGTGTKYIKARLTESYDTRWEFSSNAFEGGWQNVITIYHS